MNMETKDYNPSMTKEEKRSYQEINRYYVRHDYNDKLCKSRSLGMCQNAGRFYIVDTLNNTVLGLYVDPGRLLEDIKKMKYDQLLNLVNYDRF
jgi:hypothetical protein